jgi:hypothetical protein
MDLNQKKGQLFPRFNSISSENLCMQFEGYSEYLVLDYYMYLCFDAR